jgi:hypothetical protein
VRGVGGRGWPACHLVGCSTRCGRVVYAVARRCVIPPHLFDIRVHAYLSSCVPGSLRVPDTSPDTSSHGLLSHPPSHFPTLPYPLPSISRLDYFSMSVSTPHCTTMYPILTNTHFYSAQNFFRLPSPQFCFPQFFRHFCRMRWCYVSAYLGAYHFCLHLQHGPLHQP